MQKTKSLLCCSILAFSFSLNGMDKLCDFAKTIANDMTNVKEIENDGLEAYCGESNKGIIIYASYRSDTKSFSGMFVEKGNEPNELKNPGLWFGVLKEKSEEHERIKDQQAYSDLDW